MYYITCFHNDMKKSYIGFCLICLIPFLFSGCNNTSSESKSGIEKAVADFYEADYDYEKIDEAYNKNTDSYSNTVYEGQVFNNPYKEHFEVVSPDSNSITKEIYYDNNWIFGSVRAHVLTDDGWVLQTVSRNRPMGYGKELQFKLDREETIDGKKVEVYTTEYTESVSKLYQIQEDITYTVKQEYYLDKEQKVLIRIVSDTSDCIEKTAIANDMSANGYTLEQAQNNVKQQLPASQQKDNLNIFNYGNATEIEWPDFK